MTGSPLHALEQQVARYSNLVVAFSGGVDSAVLVAAAHRVLGESVLAVTADSPSIAREELRAATALAASIGVRHLVVNTGEVDDPSYIANDRSRCFICKQTLFQTLAQLAKDQQFDHVAYGYTLDDAGDFRPGHAAAEAFGVRAPLFDAGMRKMDVRAAARELGLEVWDKPAAPCLSSRIPYGSAVTVEKLHVIEQFERVLHDLGFRECRARFDGQLIRIEVLPAEIARAASLHERFLSEANALGVNAVLVDVEGFVSGKLNREVTPGSA